MGCVLKYNRYLLYPPNTNGATANIRTQHPVARPAKLITYSNRILLRAQRGPATTLRCPPGAQAPVVGPKLSHRGHLFKSGLEESATPQIRGC